MKITVLKDSDMKQVFTMKDAIQADKDALEIYSKGNSDVPLRVNLDIKEHEGQSLYMPGYAGEANALGVKIVSVYPKNIEKGLNSVPATMVLVNNETGEVSSIMDGTYLTRIRTGAVAGAATDILAREDSHVFALFGTGGQAESQLEAVLCVRPIKEVRVFDISLERASAFAKKMQAQFGELYHVNIIAAKTPEEAILDADIITSVTTSRKPTFPAKLVKAGVHINGVGAYTPEMQELDEDLIVHTKKVYVDTRDGALNESGNFLIPIKKGIYSKERVAGELGEIIAGTIKGRENSEERTVFVTTGSGVLDIVTAQRIYEHAIKKGIGTQIEF